MSIVKRPTVLLDCDGVLADFIGSFLEIVRHVTGITVDRSEVAEWNLSGCSFMRNLHEPQLSGIWHQVTSPGFASGLQPIPGAKEGVAALQKVADVYVVTSPLMNCATWAYEREAWLLRHFGVIRRNVIHANAKHLVQGDVFVDDRTRNVEEWKRANRGGTALLWAVPSNANVTSSKDMLRTNDWRDALVAVGL